MPAHSLRYRTGYMKMGRHKASMIYRLMKIKDPTLRVLLMTPVFWLNPMYYAGAFRRNRLFTTSFWINTWDIYIAVVYYGAFSK